MADGSANPERACDRCRERRVKCDKTHPSCLRCAKLGKPCPGYAKKRKFVDEGVLLRKKFHHDDETDGARPFKSIDASSADASSIISPNEPDRLHQSIVYSLSTPDTATGVLGIASTNGDAVDGLNNELMSSTFDPTWFDLDPSEFYGMSGNSCGFLPNAPNIVDEVDKNGGILRLKTDTPAGMSDNPLDGNDWNVWASESQLNTSSRISDDREHEMAFLIRHFSESIGPWMDLFDCERHFAQLVPLKALRDVLLKNAMAAVAAKQLGCIKGSKPYMSQAQRPATMELIEENGIDWFYKAANYYDKAIMCSRAYLAALTGSTAAPASPSVVASLSVADTDDLLLAVSIFSLYEYLDNADFGWIQHLTGLKSILSVMNPPSLQPKSLDHTALGRRASFWNFARADYQAAFINKTTTLLDTNNMAVWHDSGLQVQSSGMLYTDPDALANDRGALSATNQLVAHTLLYILLRIMNFLFTQHDDEISKQAQWQKLVAMLDVWQSVKPRAFQPCARVRHNMTKSKNGSSSSIIDELFFSIPICAATVQLYHFARLLLLLNRPGVPDVKQHNDQQKDELLSHAYTIIGIALGRPQPAVRVEMVLPLYLAGSCLQADDERQIVVDMLTAIGKDTGCVAGRRIKELTNAWSWPSEQRLVAVA